MSEGLDHCMQEAEQKPDADSARSTMRSQLASSHLIENEVEGILFEPSKVEPLLPEDLPCLEIRLMTR